MNTPPPATPPAVSSAPAAAPAAPAIDPFAALLAERIGKQVLGEPSEPKPEPEPAIPVAAHTISEVVSRKTAEAAAEAAEGVKKADEAAKAAAPAATELKPVKLIKSAPPAPTAAPAPAAVAQPAAPAAKPAGDEDYIAKLTENQREELELARFAELRNPEKYKGHAEKLIAYFKKVDEFAAENPEAEPGSDEFQAFTDEHRPKYNEGDRKKMERLQIIEEAKRATAADSEVKLNELRREQQAMKAQPVIDAGVARFRDGLKKTTLPEGMARVDEDVFASLESKGYAQAAKEFPVEAPLIQSSITAASEYLRLTNGAAEYNPKNQTHSWLLSFVRDQEQRFAATGGEMLVRNGQKFASRSEYNSMTDEQKAAHWAFSDQQVLSMIEVNAHLAINARYKELEASGFVKKSKAAPSETPKPAAIAAAKPASPRAGSSMSPGPAKGDAGGDPEVNSFMARLPNFSKVAA